MNKKEMKEKFEKNVEFLKKNIPPDDIYLFAEQTFMAALYFIYKWSEWVDIHEECLKDPVAKKWISNIGGFQMCKDQGDDVQLDLNLESVEE